MNSLAELNSWGATGVPFEDTRPTEATFAVPENQVIWATESQANYALPQGIDLLSAQSISANSTYTISSVPTGHSIAWTDPLPYQVAASTPAAGSYRLTGPLVPVNWQQVREPTLQTTGNVSGAITANLTVGTGLSTQCTIDLVYPYTNLTWSYGNTVSDTKNCHDDLQVTGLVRGSLADPIVATGATGNISNITVGEYTGGVQTSGNFNGVTIESSGIAGNVLVTAAGNIANPFELDAQNQLSGWSSQANLQVSLKTTANVSLPMPAPAIIKFTVDGVYQVTGSNVGASSTLSFIQFNAVIAASGKNAKWPMTIYADWPNLINSGAVYRVWVVDGYVSNSAAFLAKADTTNLTLTAGKRSKLIDTQLNPKARTVTISTAMTQPSYTWPSTTISWPHTIVIEQAGGLPWPQDGVFIYTKTGVAVGDALRSRSITRSA